MANLVWELLSNHVRVLSNSGASFNQQLYLAPDAFEELKSLIRANDESSKKMEENSTAYTYAGPWNHTPHLVSLESEQPILTFEDFQFKININNG